MSRELKRLAVAHGDLKAEQRRIEDDLKDNQYAIEAWIDKHACMEHVFVYEDGDMYVLLCRDGLNVYVRNMQTGHNENWHPNVFADNLMLLSEKQEEEEAARNDSTRVFYTDGGCNPNPGKGAWVYVETKNDRVCAVKTAFKRESTNNEMEATAALMVLRDLKPGSRARITTDSQYVVNAISKWRKGWFTYVDGVGFLLKKLDLKNVAIFKEIHMLIESQKLEIEMVWVKGHAGNKYNEFCDGICTESIEKEKSLTISVQQTPEERDAQLKKDMGLWRNNLPHTPSTNK